MKSIYGESGLLNPAPRTNHSHTHYDTEEITERNSSTVPSELDTENRVIQRTLSLYLQTPEESIADPLLSDLFEKRLLPKLDAVIRRLRLPPDSLALVRVEAAGSLYLFFRRQRLKHQEVRNTCGSTKDQETLFLAPLFDSLEKYLGTVVRHVSDEHLRKRFSERARLKNRMRYALEATTGLRLWEADGALWGGKALWHDGSEGMGSSPDSEAFTLFLEDPTHFIRSVTDIEGSLPAAAVLRRILNVLFDTVSHPIRLECLVDAVAIAWGVSGAFEVLLEDVIAAVPRAGRDDLLERLPFLGYQNDIVAALSDREYLRQIWEEVCQLPSRQRAALLLNLRDVARRGVLELFAETGVVGMEEVRRSLTDSLPYLADAERWKSLRDAMPLEDTAIARELGISRQQVINLRKVARERLERRLQK